MDSFLTRGTRTTFGSPIVPFIPDQKSIVVGRKRRAGAITVGKINLPEFGAGSQHVPARRAAGWSNA